MEEKFLTLVQSNIDKYGLHITLVSSNTVPRFAYTIGLTKTVGFELVLAGAIFFMRNDLNDIINTIAERVIETGGNVKLVDVKEWGTFTLVEADESWTKLMALGVFNYYKTSYVPVLQIIPSGKFYTLDIPAMTELYNPDTQPVWKWLTEPWNLPVPEKATVVVDIKALLGYPVTEAMRWEEDKWEIFTEPPDNIDKKDMRVVSIATLLGIDSSLHVTLNFKVGAGAWRESKEDEWVPMHPKENEEEEDGVN